MARTQTTNRVDTLADLLQRIDQGNDLRDLCHEAGQLADQVKPRDIAIAEQALVESGYAEEVVVPAGQVLPVPAGLSMTDAAAPPPPRRQPPPDAIRLQYLCSPARSRPTA